MRNCDIQAHGEINFPDDATLRVNKASAIYRKLKAFYDAKTAYKLPINRNKVAILVKNTTSQSEERGNNGRAIPQYQIC